jgi:hypothetical protein
VLAVTALVAEGLLDIGWIHPLSGGIGEDNLMVGNGKPWIALALMVPVVGYLVAPGSARWLRSLLILIAISGFLLSGMDVLLRLSSEGSGLPRWRPQLPWSARFDPNLDFKQETSGNLARTASEREPHVIIFKTDAAGFRNTHGADDIDLLVIGDSLAVGENTTQDRIFARLLETQYGRRVYNLSHPGSPYYDYINFLIESPRMTFQRHARVIWTFYTGDLYGSYGNVWDPAALPWQNGWRAWATTEYRTFRTRSPVRQEMIARRRNQESDVNRGAATGRELPDGQPILFNRLTEEQGALTKTEVERVPHFPRLERTMVEMRNRVAERGLDLTVVLIPAKGEVYRWILDQRERKPEDADPSGFALAVLDVCQRVQIRCLDAKPDLIKEAYRLFDSSGEHLYWRDDPHLNDHGHEAVARFIAREILQAKNHPPKSSCVTIGSADASPSGECSRFDVAKEPRQ